MSGWQLLIQRAIEKVTMGKTYASKVSLTTYDCLHALADALNRQLVVNRKKGRVEGRFKGTENLLAALGASEVTNIQAKGKRKYLQIDDAFAPKLLKVWRSAVV